LSADVPRLETARLILRGFTPADVEPYVRMLADPEVARFLGDGQPLHRVDAWRQLAMLIGHWELRGFGLWAVEERASGRLIGRIGCHEPEGWPGFELGYALARDAWGQGYAREGAAAALAFARRELGRDAIISLIRPANSASIAVAEHFGARCTGSVEFFGAPTDIYTYPVRS
jgi:RimJ/RimL family protein N-acetyltransferase